MNFTVSTDENGQTLLEFNHEGRRVRRQLPADEALNLGLELLQSAMGPRRIDFELEEARAAVTRPGDVRTIDFVLRGFGIARVHIGPSALFSLGAALKGDV